MVVEIRTILLAEDNPKDVELTIEALAEHNLANNVFVVRDGVETMNYLRHEGKYKQRKPGNPAVLLLDLKMLPVVILTSSREEQDLIRSYELGVNAYVVKPVDFKDFIEAVKQIGIFWALINEAPPAGILSDKDKK